MNWQLSSDGKKLIGNLILKHDPNMVKSSSTSTMDSSSEFSICSSLGIISLFKLVDLLLLFLFN